MPSWHKFWLTLHVRVTYLGEEDFVIGFETPLECLLKPKREHDEPRVIGVATNAKKAQNEPGNQKGQTPEKPLRLTKVEA